MTFLELCRALRQEAGIPSSTNGPSTVANQTGEMKRIVDWVNNAYLDIQSMHDDWRFMRRRFEFTLTVNQREYTRQQVIAAAGLTTGIMAYVPDSMRIYLPAEGIETEWWLCHVDDWDVFRDTFLFGAHQQVTGRPRHVAVSPSVSIVFDVIPDAAYRFYGDYVTEPTLMQVDSDVPILPEWAHGIIIWHALLRYAGFEESSAQYAHAKNMYEALLYRLEERELPGICAPTPIA